MMEIKARFIRIGNRAPRDTRESEFPTEQFELIFEDNSFLSMFYSPLLHPAIGSIKLYDVSIKTKEKIVRLTIESEEK